MPNTSRARSRRRRAGATAPGSRRPRWPPRRAWAIFCLPAMTHLVATTRLTRWWCWPPSASRSPPPPRPGRDSTRDDAGVGSNSHFRQYLPRLVRYWDDEAPGTLHRRLEASMVFVDISGFTKMSERLARHGNVGAEEVTEVIDSTFGSLLPEAYGYGANLLKFGG